ncbi:MAG: thiamine biosynthesis protein ThiS [Chloroflexi bacterium]|nr:thiamine biosynthesis protein ThiS [Chloroflexota bacterium]|tara:strand:- start:881 stop:1087 length:207 start_codon:yes stop_codon:yes gene_type:complete
MKILFLNGVKISIEKEIDITTFLEKQNLSQKKIAIAINGFIIPKKDYQKTIINEGDKIEIVHAVGGGI